MNKFCESLREHAMEIIDINMKNMELLTNEQQKSYQKAKISYIRKEKCE